MATITAAAGGGNWSAGGSWVGGSAPGSGDDVLLTGTSGNVTIDVNVACRSINCTGFTGTLTHNAAATLSIGDSTAGLTSVALLFVSGMTYTLNNAATSAISFLSTSATQQTIDFGGKTCGNLTWNGAGGSWILSSNITTAQTSSNIFTLTAGTLNLNGKTITGGLFASNNSNTRTLTLGAATINLSSNGGTAWDFTTTTGLTFNANTSTISILNTNSTVQGGGQTYNNVTIKPNGASGITLAGANTFANLTLDTGNSQEVVIKLSANQTVTGTLVTQTTGSTINPLMVASSTPGTARTITAAIATISNTDFQDIIAAGASSPWSGTRLGDAGGNTSITTDTPRTLYWVAIAGGNWNSTASWATSSGGASGAPVPLPQDSVIFDTNSITSASKTITANMRMGKNIDFSAITNSPTLSWVSTNGFVRVFGNITLASGMTSSGTTALSLEGRGAQTITTNGLSLTCPIQTNAPGGTYTMQDALTTTSNLTFIWGTFATGNLTITCSTLVASSTTGVKVFTAGTSTINITSTAVATVINLTGTNTTWSATNATFVIANASANARTIAGGGLTLGTLTYTVAGSTGSLTISGGGTTVGTLNFSDASNARTLTLTSSQTFNITTAFNVNGFAANLVTLNSSSSGTAATLSYSGAGVINCDYLSVKDSTPSQVKIWFAGHNSTFVSNTGNWVAGTGFVSSLSGTHSFAGSILKVSRAPFNTVLSFAGTLAIPGITRSLSAAISYAGVFTKRTAYPLPAASLTVSGAFARQFSRNYAATLTYTGKFARQSLYLITGGLSFAGTFGHRANKKLTGVLTYTGATRRAIAHQLSASMTITNYIFGSGTFGGSGDFGIGPTDSLVKRTNMPIAATVTSSGAIGRAMAHVFAATLTYTGNLKRAIARSLTASASYTGNLARSLRHAFAATLSTVTQFVGGSMASFNADIQLSGSLTRGISAILTGGASFTGKTTRTMFRTLTSAAFSLSGAFTKTSVKVVQGSISAIGGFAHTTQKKLVATLGITGTLPRTTIRPIDNFLSYTGNLQKTGQRTFTGATGFVGVIVHLPQKYFRATMQFKSKFLRFLKEPRHGRQTHIEPNKTSITLDMSNDHGSTHIEQEP